MRTVAPESVRTLSFREPGNGLPENPVGLFAVIRESGGVGAVEESDLDLDVARATYLQRDAIHPSAEGVALIVGGIGPVVLGLIAQ